MPDDTGTGATTGASIVWHRCQYRVHSWGQEKWHRSHKPEPLFGSSFRSAEITAPRDERRETLLSGSRISGRTLADLARAMHSGLDKAAEMDPEPDNEATSKSGTGASSGAETSTESTFNGPETGTSATSGASLGAKFSGTKATGRSRFSWPQSQSLKPLFLEDTTGSQGKWRNVYHMNTTTTSSEIQHESSRKGGYEEVSDANLFISPFSG